MGRKKKGDDGLDNIGQTMAYEEFQLLTRMLKEQATADLVAGQRILFRLERDPAKREATFRPRTLNRTGLTLTVSRGKKVEIQADITSVLVECDCLMVRTNWSDMLAELIQTGGCQIAFGLTPPKASPKAAPKQVVKYFSLGQVGSLSSGPAKPSTRSSRFRPSSQKSKK